MSYILDALKKSEMQARQGELPDIHSSHVLHNGVPSRPGWQFVIFGGVATCMAFAIAYVLLSGSEDNLAGAVVAGAVPQSMDSAIPIQQQIPPVASNPATPAANIPPASSPQTARIPTQALAETPPEAADTAAEVAAEVASHTSDPTVQHSTALAIPMPDIRPQTRQDGPAPLLRSLPVSVQESLPPIDISGHIYDERPAARMVFINDHIQREGDSLASGLKLLGITPNGVELSFRNTPFRIELFPMPAQKGY